MKTWYDLSEKDATKGCLGTLIIFFFFVFSFLYRDYEERYLQKHGVWTVLTITKRIGDSSVYYKFNFNNQVYERQVSMSKDEINLGNRFFVLVDPVKLGRHRIYNVAPEWLEAPPNGWKKRPVGKVLLDMLPENYKKRTSENALEEIIGEDELNQAAESEDGIRKKEQSDEKNDIFDYFFKMFLLFLSGIFLSVLFFYIVGS